MDKYSIIENDIVNYFDGKIVFYEDSLEIKQYDKSIRKKEKGLEQVKEEKLYNSKIIDKKLKDNIKVIRSDNIYRTKKVFNEFVKANISSWKSFITLTFKENMEDIDIANKCFNSYISHIRRIYPNFSYICSLEFQKRGSIHYHVLTDLECGCDVLPKRERKRLYNKITKQYEELDYYDLKYWNKGFSSAKDILDTDDNFDVALYMTKYMTKDIDNRLFGRKRILKSNNLKMPITKDVKDKENLTPIIEYLKINDYEIKEQEITPKREYALPYTSISVKGVSSENMEVIKQLLINLEKESDI